MNNMLLISLLMLLYSCSSSNGDDPKAQELEKLGAMVNEVSAKLNNLGFSIKPELISIEIKDSSDMKALFEAINDQARPEIEAGNDAHHQPALSDRLAFYDPNSKKIIFQSGAADKMTKGYLAHELAHAYQEQKWGFKKIWGSYKNKPSRELYNIINYIIEGHAELAREAYEQSEAHNMRESLELALDLGKVFENDCIICSPHESAANLPYSLGLRFMLRAYVKGGWRQVESYFTHLPSSSEQILHPDEPANTQALQIILPRWLDKKYPAELVLEGPMGEAALLAKLLSLGVGRQEAFLTSSGYSADNAQLYRREDQKNQKDQEEALIWRIAFDRELDAKQLEYVLSQINISPRVMRIGRTVDWIITNNQSMAQRLRIFMSQHPSTLKPNSAQESSTHNLELKVKHDALGFVGPYSSNKIHVGPHPK